MVHAVPQHGVRSPFRGVEVVGLEEDAAVRVVRPRRKQHRPVPWKQQQLIRLSAAAVIAAAVIAAAAAAAAVAVGRDPVFAALA